MGPDGDGVAFFFVDVDVVGASDGEGGEEAGEVACGAEKFGLLGVDGEELFVALVIVGNLRI